MATNSVFFHQHKAKIIWILFLFSFVILIVRNNYNVFRLKSYGLETKAFVYRKYSVGSKGTIRCFYRFVVNGKQYEGFYDNGIINQGDSISIIFYPPRPSLNQAKQFILNYE